jgi:transcription elongation factor Elf1
MKVKVNTTGLGCSWESDIVCPFCGGKQSDSWDYGKGEDIGEVECGHCSRTFHASRNVEVTYSSSPSANSPRYWNKGDVFDDGIEDIEEEEWANTNGENPCEVMMEEA